MTSILKADTIQDTDGNNIINENSNTITIGASGDTTNIIGTLQNNGAAVGGTNTPAFFAHLSAEQVVSSATFTKLQANTEIMDVGGYYDNSTNYRYTPLVAGKYFVFGAIHLDATGGNYVDGQVEVRKNGTKVNYIAGRTNTSVNRGTEFTQTVSGIIDMNGSSDYIELWGYLSVNSGSSDFENSYGTNFGAYKIIE